jgi:CcmD family protein
LEDHRERFAPVTVTAQDGVAAVVVEKESGRLETNLTFLFAVYTVTWAGFFAYVFYVSRKQRELQREVARLRGAMEAASTRERVGTKNG